MDREREGGNRGVTLQRLLASNETRLDRLDHAGVPLVVDGSAVVEFLFERVMAHTTANDFKLSWALNVAGLLNELESDVRTAQAS
jgi:hypothetical protein